MLRILKGNWAVATLILLEFILFVLNFKSGTYLMGWDGVMPELNFSQNFQRNLFSVWQEYRGLGLVDGMSYAANLPHTVFLWILNFILPVSLLRYFFIFLMHVTGGLGMYFLLKRILFSGLHVGCVKAVSLAGAFFYLFNLATIQMFYAPLEAFAVHFAFLPWLVFSLISYVKSGARRDLLIFALFSFLSLPQAFVPQLFAVYIFLGILVALFNTRSIKKLLTIALVIFAINAFWALPYAYSALTNSSAILDAKINQMSSGDIFLKNQDRGDFSDVISLRGFMLDVIEYDGSGQNLPIMKAWVDHTNSIGVWTLSIVFFLIALVGLIGTVRKGKRALYPFFAAFIIAFLILGNNIPVLKQINDLIREGLPMVGEAFRFSFTKFVTLFALCYTIFFAFGTHVLLSRFKSRILLVTCHLSLVTCILFSALPAFGGHFVFDSVRVDIPEEYQKTFEFFNAQDTSTRVAILPQSTFWSWRFHNNGYRGSGFIWYGIPQASLDRAFDPWSRENENYYWELSYAIYSKNVTLFESVLEKYQINWILIDENVVNPSSPKALFNDETLEMLSQTSKVEQIQTFNKIKIYRVNLNTPVNKYVYLADNLPTVGPTYKWNNYDQAFLENGNYISESNAKEAISDRYYPYRSLFTGRSQKELEFEIQENPDYFAFGKKLPTGTFNYVVEVPEIKKEDLMWVNPDDLAKAEYLLRDIYLSSSAVEIKVPKVGGYFGADISAPNDLEEVAAKNCDNRGSGQVKNEVIKEESNEFLRLHAIDAANCSAAFYLPTLPHNLGYLITVESRNIKGKTPVFWLENLSSRKADIETHLPSGKKTNVSYFVQPPMESDGLGYTIHVDNASIGGDESVNDIGDIKVYPLPYKFLTTMVMVRSDANPLNVSYMPINVDHNNPSVYEVESDEWKGESKTLVLSQSFNSGWHAYVGTPFIGREVKEHVMVNNWANGWNVKECPMTNDKCQITIVYLPQYLEYLGFVILGLMVVVLVWKIRRRA